MCLATPVKIVKIKDDWATVDTGRESQKVNIGLVKNLKVGDYILAHGDLAVNKLPKDDALKILEMIDQYDHHHCSCDHK